VKKILKNRIISSTLLALLIVSLLITLSTQTTKADLLQPPAIEWSRTFGGPNEDYGNWLIKTSDGGYLVTGVIAPENPASVIDYWDGLLVKTDSAGNTVWSKTFEGIGQDYLYRMIQTSDQGYLLQGWTDSYNDGNREIWLIKIDNLGNTIWSKTYPDAPQSGWTGLVQTGDGGYALAAGTYGLAGGIDVTLTKLDTTGNIQWTKSYGGSGFDCTNALIQMSDGGYAIAGRTTSSTGNQDFLLIRTDASGNMLWSKAYGGPSEDGASDMVGTADGGFAIVGYTYSYGAGGMDAWLVKIDSNGNMLWDKTYGGTGTDLGTAIVQTFDGGYALTGPTSSFGAGSYDFYLVRTDANGNLLWSDAYGGPNYDWASGIIQASDGGYVLVGFINQAGDAGTADFWLLKVASDSAPVLDNLPPTISVESPVDGQEYSVGEAVLADWSVTDSESGVASTIATVASGTLIDTSSIGLKSFTLTATDNAGNTATKTVTYTVSSSYTSAGFIQPINNDGSSVFKLGSTVPVKFQLQDTQGNYITSAQATLYVAKVSDNIIGTDLEAVSTSSATTGNQFRADNNQYIFNLSTKSLTAGTWQIKAVLDDGTTLTVLISLR